MKRVFLILLVTLIVICSLTACSTSTSPPAPTVSNNVSIIETIEPTQPTETTSLQTFGLPDEHKVVYNKNNIEITYTGQKFDINNYDEYYFSVKNNSKKNIVFSISSVAINGSCTSAQYKPDFIETQTTASITIRTRINTRYEVCQDISDVVCLQFVGFIVEASNKEELKYNSIIEDNINFEITEKNHSHTQDTAIIKGDLVYEDNEVSIYVNSKPVDDYPHNNFAYSVVNKTNKNIFITFDSAKYQIRYMSDLMSVTQPIGIYDYIVAKTFATGTFYLYNTRGQDVTQMDLSIYAVEKTALSNSTELSTSEKPLLCNGKSFKIKVIAPE